MLEERQKGGLADVAAGTTEKLVRRHPHVFGEDATALSELPTRARTASEVRANWDAIKQTEGNGGEPFGSLPENLPALLYARKVQRRASGDEVSPWDALSNVARAVGEAERAVASEGDEELRYERIGALLFACVELSRATKVDPEIALRRSAERLRAQVEASEGDRS